MLVQHPTVPPPTAAARDKALRLLNRALGASKLRTDPDVCASYVADESEAVGIVPSAVVLAETPDDVTRTLAACREAGVCVTPRAAGTGRTGGATPVAGGVVLSVLGMDKIKDIDRREGIAVVEPGVILSDFHDAVEREGLFYPPDPNSKTSCALGGNVAENAGGPRAFKYGVTRQYVLGLEAQLMGGQRIVTGCRTVKGVTGYDMTALLVGSEGTLAVFGDITLRLVPKPDAVTTLLALFPNAREALRAVGEILAARLVPRCIEFLDENTLEAMRNAGSALPEKARSLLLIEVDGDELSCERQAERIAGACAGVKTLELLVARDGAQRERLWQTRREMSPVVRRMSKYKLSEDVVVPRQKLTTLLDRVRAHNEPQGVRTVTYGHAGDGNLHVNFLWDDPSEVPKIDASIRQLFLDVLELGGTLSGEHGIGVLKAPYLGMEQSAELIGLQRDVKRLFDPEGLLNPGKIFPSPGHGPC
jgi:glycolate oxidase